MSKEKIIYKNEFDNLVNSILTNIDLSDLSDLIIVGIKTRGEYIAKRIHTILEDKTGNKIEFGTLDISFYRDDFKNKSKWPDLKKTEIPGDIEDKNIILVDDVLYTGRTTRAALNAIMDYGRPSSVKLAVLVDRGHREMPIQPDFVGVKVDTLSSQKVNVYINEVDNKEEVEIIDSDGV